MNLASLAWPRGYYVICSVSLFFNDNRVARSSASIAAGRLLQRVCHCSCRSCLPRSAAPGICRPGGAAIVDLFLPVFAAGCALLPTALVAEDADQRLVEWRLLRVAQRALALSSAFLRAARTGGQGQILSRPMVHLCVA